ncbi:MAG: DUF4846 domain-containing protein [Lachnospiraceae bacterium]|nr:DUF4846 domain-containing protein [Lachnospiraceae bacterium]
MDKKEVKLRRFALILMILLIAGIAISLIPTLTGHDDGKGVNTDAKMTKTSSGKKSSIKYDFINPSGETLETRINTPKGFSRSNAEKGSLTEFIRNYHVEADGTPVHLYTGKAKTSKNHVAVFSMKVGEKDLQQCADSVIRMYAEYFRSVGKDSLISFHFTNGFKCDWDSFRSGKRISVSGNTVTWGKSGPAGNTDEIFEAYLNTVFTYAGTASMNNEVKEISELEVQVGDVFLKGGSPGHVVMVVDTCEKDGKKAFLLAQGYMPAQQFHVLKNPLHKDDPWYYVDEIKYPFYTPEYTFGKGSLKRPLYQEP